MKENSRLKKIQPLELAKGKVLPRSRATLVVCSAKLQAEVLRLENLGLLAKWYGVSCNWDQLIRWWKERWGSNLQFKTLQNGFFWLFARPGS